MQLYTKILLGLVLGALAGLLPRLPALGWLGPVLVRLEPVGTVFIRLITMIVIPLVVASLLLGVVALGDLRKLGRLGAKTLGYYLTTTALAVVMGLLISNVVRPGARIAPETREHLAAQFQAEAAGRVALMEKAPSVTDVLVNAVPRNPVRAAADFDLLPLIVFTLIFGAAVTQLSQGRKQAFVSFFEAVNEASMTVIRWVMQLAPYAVFALLAAVVARFGLDLLRSLLVYALCVALGLALHAFGTLALIVRLAARLNPMAFFRRIAAAPLVAFSTSSSNATLPVTIEVAGDRLGISTQVRSFVLPLGATINMDGTALYQAVAVMFIAQIYGIPLDIGKQLVIVLTATLASIGAAGVPSAGIITLIVVLQSVGMSAQVQAGIAMILGVDRILDMLRTAVNVTGDLTAAAFVARSEGETIPPPDGTPAAASLAGS